LLVKIEIQRSFPLTRVALGAAIFVSGVLLYEHVNELLGLLLVLVGVVVGVPRATGLILQILFLVLYLSIWIGYFYWAESGEFGPSLDEWLSDKWWFVVYMAGLVFGPLIFQYRANADAWQTLRESSSSDLESVGSRDAYPAVSGMLIVDTEYFDANVVCTELGIFVTRDDGGHVYLPWDRVQRIVFEEFKPRRAKVHFSRKLMNLLVLDLPWHEDMMGEIPRHVKVDTYA
jgi:hypothetical protein